MGREGAKQSSDSLKRGDIYGVTPDQGRFRFCVANTGCLKKMYSLLHETNVQIDRVLKDHQKW